MNQVCVIIPMYNFDEVTDRCVEALRSNEDMPFDIVVVDDGSTVPYANIYVHVIRLEENTGFTNAANTGIRWCENRYKYIHLLNNDTVPRPNFIKHLYEFMEGDPVTGIANSIKYTLIEGKKRTEVHSIDLIRGYIALYEDWVMPDDQRWDKDAIYCDWVSLSSSMIRYEMIREIGLLYKHFRNYCSDSEYCIRANQNGWNVAVLPKSIVEHYHQTTVKTLNIDTYSDQKLFIEKLSGVKYQQLMNRLPLDKELNTWGKLEFSTVKHDNAN